MNRIRIKTLLALAGMFILGVVTGWLQGRHYPLSNILRPKNSIVLQQQIVDRLKYRLDLSKDQVEKIRPIISPVSLEIVQTQNEMLDKISAILNSRDEQVYPFLDAKQQEKLAAMKERRKKFLEHVN